MGLLQRVVSGWIRRGWLCSRNNHVPMSHPFVEKIIGSIRRELLDQTLFWTATDLESKLRDYQAYYNECRCHASRDDNSPVESGNNKVADISSYRWEKHCRGLFQLPVAV